MRTSQIAGKGGRRADGQRRVFWKPADTDKVIPRAAELLFLDSKLGVGPAIIQAQRDVLPQDRQRPESTLKNVAAGKYGKLVRAHLQDLMKDVKKKPVQTITTKGEPLSVLSEPAAAPLDTDQFFKMVASATGMDKIAQALARTCAGMFETYLEKEMQDSYRRVVLKMGTQGMPSLVSLQGENGQVQGTSQQQGRIFGKVKVVLLGDDTDARYFEKIRRGMEDYYDFISVRKPGDIPGNKAMSEVKLIVASGSNSTGPLAHAFTAVTALAPKAEVFKGKGSNDVNALLEDRWQRFQEEAIQGSLRS